MSKRKQGILASISDINLNTTLGIREALEVLERYKDFTKFDESVDICFTMGNDPKKTDQNVKGVCVLPHGNGKKVSVNAFAEGDQVDQLKKNGALEVGGEDLIDKILSGSLVPHKHFTSVIATQDMMPKIAKSKVAAILGKSGLMPNVKFGTVSNDLLPALTDALNGKVDFKTDKSATIKISVGKISFGVEKLEKNIVAIYQAIKSLKPASIKGSYFLSLGFSTTMSPFCLNVKMSDLYAKA